MFFFGVPAVIFVSCTASAINGANREPDEYDAQVQCQEWVKDKLKAPATADFGAISRSGTLASGFTITGTVDAENSFGAKLRNTWVCKIKASGDQWVGNVAIG